MIKKIITGLCLINLLVVLTLTGCGNDDKELEEKAAGLPVEFLAGRWKVDMILTEELKKLKEKSVEDYRTLMAEMVDSSYMDFQVQDSIYIGRFGPDLSGGKWQISTDSRHVIITDLTGAEEILRILNITKDRLVLLNLSARSGITIELSK